MDPYASHQRLLVATALQSSGDMVEMGCGNYSTPILAEIAAYQGRNFEVYTTDREWGSKFENLCKVNYIESWSEYPYPKCGFTFLDNEEYVRDRKLHVPRILEASDVVICHDFGENIADAKYSTTLQGNPPSVVMSNVIDIKINNILDSTKRKNTPKDNSVASGARTRDELSDVFHGTGIELGVAAGDYSDRILRNNNVEKLYSIDRWSDHHDMQEYLNVMGRFSQYGSRSVVMRATFEESLDHFEDDSMDFIYIDGYAHTGQEGGKTLDQWWPKIKEGGLFAGHDYHEDWPLTIKTVDEFAARHGLEISITKGDQYPSWSVVKPLTSDNRVVPNVACVYKTGGDYTAEYVWRLHKDIVRYSDRNINFIVYTDSDEILPGKKVKLKEDLPGWWSKLELFSEFNGRTVYFDLDTIIAGSLESLYDYDGPMALIRDFYDPEMLSTGVMAWNSAMPFMMPTPEEKETIVKNRVRPEQVQYSFKQMDQFYVVDKLKEKKWHVDIVQDIIPLVSYKAHCMNGIPDNASIVCFHGKPRPHEVNWLE